MNPFGAKRKARPVRISTEEESFVTEETDRQSQVGGDNAGTDNDQKLFTSRTARKPIKSSRLRRSQIPGNDEENSNSDHEDGQNADSTADIGPAVVRPNVARLGSGPLRSKKRPPGPSRMSFDDEAGDDGDKSDRSYQKAAGPRLQDGASLRKGVTSKNLPMRSFMDDDDDRPKYSKEFLDELKSSTPTTPVVAELHLHDADEMDLDASELEGALIVDPPTAVAPPTAQTTILTAAEVSERKERRARLAQEQGVLSVDDDDDDDDEDRPSWQKEKNTTRLKPDDEEMGEGFDSFVEDGGLSLDRRAQKERRRRDRQQMAELITAAEGGVGSDASTSDSDDAERRIAYEASQSRAGMDGIKNKASSNKANGRQHETAQIPSKITPLPELADCLSQLEASLKTMQAELDAKTARVAQLTQEKVGVDKRKEELQVLLDEAGTKYQQALGMGTGQDGTKPLPGAAGVNNGLTGQRGLEDLGVQTPSMQPMVHDSDS